MSRGEDSAVGSVVRFLLVLVLFVAVVVYGGGGWYFSQRIHDDALEVKPNAIENNLRITARGTARLFLRAYPDASARADLAKLVGASTYGVVWQGGYGQVSGTPTAGGEDTAVKRFRLLKGGPPRAGQKAHLALGSFPEDDPASAVGDTVKQVGYGSPLARFPAYVATPTPQAAKAAGSRTTWAVLVHGKGANRSEMYRMMRGTLAAGLTSMDISYRNDEGERHDASDQYGYGATEWADLAAAVRYARAQGATRVVLGADSMGAGIVASYLRHRRAGDSAAQGAPVSGLVLDAPMLSFAETIRWGARQITLPLVGPVPDSLTWTARQIAGVRFGIDWGGVDYLDDTSWATMPILVFHGDEDTTVPLATSRELARRATDVELVAVPGTEHVRSWNTNPRAYQSKVVSFLRALR